MIVLDTNVVSEAMRAEPNRAVVEWVQSHPPHLLFTTSVNKAEVFYGIGLLPQGRRKAALAEAARAVFDDDFAGRVLPFDATAAIHYAEIVVARRRSGKPIQPHDAQIAAITVAVNAVIATRDVEDFEGCGITIINPWTTTA